MPWRRKSPISIFIGLDKQNFERKSVNIPLPISFKICFGYGSFEYPQHMFWLKIKFSYAPEHINISS